MMEIEWDYRENGEKPTNTFLSTNEIKKYDKDLLIDYYESKVKFIEKENS